MKRLKPAACVASVFLIAILAPHARAHTRSTDVTWTKDIAPIVASRCASCHAPDGAAQPSLIAFRDAQVNARAIRAAVLEGRMPPWPAARGLGDFSNDRSLTALEVELLTAWVDGNAPLGRTDDVSAPGPDQNSSPTDHARTIRVPAGHPVKSVDSFRLETGAGGELWVSGWGFRPGSPELIERVTFRIDGGELLGSWTSGDPFVRYPPGIASRIAPAATLVAEIHYRKSTVVETPASALELLISDRPRHVLHHRLLGCQTTFFGRPIDALAVTPATSGGESLEVAAHQSDGSVDPLVVIPEFDPATQVTYRLRRPLRLASGSRIDVRSSSLGCGAILEFIARDSRPGTGRQP